MMWPRNCGPASFQLRRAPSARSANRPLRVPIQNVPAKMKEMRARARHWQRHPAGGQFARGGCATQAGGLAGAARCARRAAVTGEPCSGGTGLTDEQMRRQHVERLEPAADVAEDALQVLQHARGELVDEKCAAGFEHIAGLAQYSLA